MSSILHRFLNRFTYYGAGVIVLGVGMSLIYSFLPNITSPQQAWHYVIGGIVLALVGIALIIIGFIKTPSFTTHMYYGVIPILQKMDEQIMKLAKQEATKVFNLEEYKKISEKYNKDVLKMETPKPKTIKGFRKSAKKMEETLNKTIKDEIHSLRDGANKLETMSAFLDIHGFGLKQQRLNNRKYLKLSQQLQYYRNLPIGTEIDSLISLHITYSESNAAMLLTIIRDGQIMIRETETKLLQEVSTDMQIKIEQIESTMKETTAKIRAKIGECLRELEKPSKQNIPLLFIKSSG